MIGKVVKSKFTTDANLAALFGGRVFPSVGGEEFVPVGAGVVSAAGEVGVVEEVVVVSWFGSVLFGLDGEAFDEPVGCVGWFVVAEG
jgi:hypothetical protein